MVATLTVVFPCFFLSCKENARVKTRKDGARPALFHILLLGLYIIIRVVRLLFVLFCVLFVCKCVLPPGDNPIAVNKYNLLLYPESWFSQERLGTVTPNKTQTFLSTQFCTAIH
jgi:hypothetical protein